MIHHSETKYAFVEFNEESAAGRTLEQKEIEIRQVHSGNFEMTGRHAL